MAGGERERRMSRGARDHSTIGARRFRVGGGQVIARPVRRNPAVEPGSRLVESREPPQRARRAPGPGGRKAQATFTGEVVPMKRFQRLLVYVDTRRDEPPPLRWASLLAE